MLNEIMKHEKFNNSEMIEFNQVESSEMFFSASLSHCLKMVRMLGVAGRKEFALSFYL